MKEEKKAVVCPKMHNEAIEATHCNFIRHASFCKDCPRNKDGREISKFQEKRARGNETK
jgi:hypothetical protein